MTISCYTHQEVCLPGVSKEDFCREFGEMTPEELVAFVRDESNGYEISKLEYYATDAHHYPGGNGRSWNYSARGKVTKPMS